MPSPPPSDQVLQPQGVEPSVKLDRFKGLKNTLTYERMAQDDLWRATNIDLDDDNQIHRRRGYTRVAVGSFHSLWTSEESFVYGVYNDVLSLIQPDYSMVPILAGVGDAYSNGGLGLDYAQVGRDVYFTGQSAAGIISTATQTVSPWGPSEDIWLSPVVNPTANLPEIRGKLLGAPPRASYITAYNGRMYIGQGRTVWCTELYAYGLVDKTRNFFQFEGEITMLGTVADGVFVGTTEGVWFLAGPAFPLKRTRVMDSPVLPRSMVYVPAELANPPQVGTQVVTPLEVSLIFQTSKGVCVGMDGGKTNNLTEHKFFFPQALRGAAMFRRQDGMNQYIAVNDSEGQPTNGARIGDYVEATIIRAKNTWVSITEGLRARDTGGV
jgi:hypothetical protein